MILILSLIIFIALVSLTLFDKANSHIIRIIEYSFVFFIFFIVFLNSYLSIKKIDFMHIPYLLTFLILSVFIYYFNKRFDKHKILMKRLSNEFLDVKNEYSNTLTQEKQNNKIIEALNEKLDQTSMIYKSTLRMSSTLNFNDTLKSFVHSLSEFDEFEKLFLVLDVVSSDQDKNKLMSYTYTESEKKVLQYELGKEEEILFQRVSKENKIQIISDPLSYGLHPGSFGINKKNKAIVVPLRFQNDFSGVLVFFANQISHFEQIELLALHFSMEIHKSKLYEKIKRLSTIDNLTLTYLRGHFFSLFEDELKRHEFYKHEMALIMIDIDKFKQINDKYGHLMGDSVIKEVAKVLKKRSREEDLIGRFGGDEFMIVLPRTSKEKAIQIANRIKNAIGDLLFYNGKENKFKVTTSMGIAMFPFSGKTKKKLFDAVDSALYKAKENGRDCVFFDN